MNTAVILVSCQPAATASSKKAIIPDTSALHASWSRSSPEVVPAGGWAISGTAASSSAEVLLYVRYHRPDLSDDLLQPVGADAETLRPIAQLIGFVELIR